MKESDACRGVEYIKTARSKHLRSIPRKQDDYSYLDLYTLDKEKERLEKELYQLEKRGGRARKRIEEITVKMEDVKQKLENAKEKVKETINEPGRKKDWKVMKVNY